MTGSLCGLRLRGRFFEGVGDRVIEGQRAAFARGGVPCGDPEPGPGGLEERTFEPSFDGILGLVVPVRFGSADECCGALVVAVHCGDGGEPTEPFEYDRPDDHLAAQRQFLAERVRGGVHLAGQQRGQAEIAAVDHPHVATVQRSRDRSRAGGEVTCVALTAKAERGVGRGGEQVRELMEIADVSVAAVSTRSRSSAMLGAAIAFARAASAISQSS